MAKIIVIELGDHEEKIYKQLIEWLEKHLYFSPEICRKQMKDLSINPFNRVVTDKYGKQIQLTAKEFDLLYFLVSHKGQVFSKEQLYNNVWGYDYPADANNLTSFIRKLRKKIEPDPDNPRYIITIRGVGYKFTEKEEP